MARQPSDAKTTPASKINALGQPHPSNSGQLRYELRAYLGALLAIGRNPQHLRTLADLVEPDTAKAGLRRLVDRSVAGRTLRAYKVACTLKLIARDWVPGTSGGALPDLPQVGAGRSRHDHEEPGAAAGIR